MAQTFNANSFGPFLEAVGTLLNTAPGPGDTSSELLRTLAAVPGQKMDVYLLMKQTTAPLTLADSIRELESAGLISTGFENGSQTVFLTPAGRAVAGHAE